MQIPVIMLAMDFDVITIGSGTQDVFLSGKAFKAHTEANGDKTEEFPLGAKIEVENVTVTTGGGATNAAVTFARNGLSTAFLGSVAEDNPGKTVREQLEAENVNFDLVAIDSEFATDYSTLLLSPSGERTVLVYRGASHNLRWSDYDLSNVKARWAYVTSCAGNFDFLNSFLDWAKENDVKVAMDPGSRELKDKPAMLKILPKLTLIKANREELGELVDADEPEEIIKKLIEYVDYAIVTDGPNGSYATDGQQVVKAGMYEDVPVKDRTGAGDAYGSGVVCKLAQGADLNEALIFGSANSTSVVQHIGAKHGILRFDAELHDMPLEVTEI